MLHGRLSIHRWVTIVLYPVYTCPYCTSITCYMIFSCVPLLSILGFPSISFEHNLCAEIPPSRETVCQSVLMLHHLTRYYYYIHTTMYKQLILLITKLHALFAVLLAAHTTLTSNEPYSSEELRAWNSTGISLGQNWHISSSNVLRISLGRKNGT